MTVAIVIAGCVGTRMWQSIPKQFISINDKPILIYTLEAFERHPKIDAIEVVCIDGWHDMLWAYAKQFHIAKLKWVVSGGNSGQESIRNGVYGLRDICAPDDTVVIHDGIRPEDATMRVSEVFPVLRVPFEDAEICVPQAYDKIIRQYYGDWMQLPPEDKRKNHPPAVLEFSAEQT